MKNYLIAKHGVRIGYNSYRVSSQKYTQKELGLSDDEMDFRLSTGQLIEDSSKTADKSNQVDNPPQESKPTKNTTSAKKGDG